MLDPHAWATTGDLDIDEGRVEVSEAEIFDFVRAREYLSAYSAWHFSEWLDEVWNDFTDNDPGYTNADVIQGALMDWCGGADPTLCAHGHRLGDTCPGCDADQDRAGGEDA